MRRNVNLLVDHGHSDAWHYPLGTLSDEAALVVERGNQRIASEAIALRSAMLTAWPGGEDASRLFNDLISRLNGE